MSKRKDISKHSDRAGNGDASGDSDEDFDMLDVDFEWFDPQPAVDFHGLKSLLRQLFDADSQLFELSALVDLILSQPTLGSTVKVDGNESDPFAFLSVINLRQHASNPAVQTLIQYILTKAASQPSLSALKSLLDPSSSAEVGLILTERFINMPHEIVPPMYTMLQEEITWAIEDKEPYRFTHYLVFSKTYIEVASKLDADDSRPAKKKKGPKGANSSGGGVFYFHPEDEVLQKHAIGSGWFDYSKADDEGASDSKRAFQEMGVKPSGHLILLEADKFEPAVKAMGEYLSPQA
ncbi:protein bcp1 [Eremomyces bilateralis CBS 781.70]|uniref:Protein BCP1 n=1 Tax=Eremomyces bilateralis CBS 781.70 TaxID=1392243 RepID=A0A6G1GG52_9PEZI|nr:protein bcp1 [Eremomyces bilateralis CBS 781.70]KAF1816906.1 protein bcp1 [Eremomyces bilateralis CBS 781.70]